MITNTVFSATGVLDLAHEDYENFKTRIECFQTCFYTMCEIKYHGEVELDIYYRDGGVFHRINKHRYLIKLYSHDPNFISYIQNALTVLLYHFNTPLPIFHYDITPPHTL